MRMTLKSSQFKFEKKSGFICFSSFLNMMGFNFSIPQLRKYLDPKTQDQPLIGMMRHQQLH